MGRTNRWQDLWVKEALDSSELQQLELLKKSVRDIGIKVGPDKWTWRGTTQQDLTVANLRYKIHEAWKTDNAEAWAFWNSWVPLKINLFNWRASMNRIPSKENLTIRGVQLASINCDRCGLRVESSQHILWECWTAKAVWWAILVWLRIPFPTTDLSFKRYWVWLQIKEVRKTGGSSSKPYL
ncbi:putative reverse transcriptase zinc-binding domain-containing protein [Helianthus annuus]|nr:putative reverse transcriptase zinc-binding domain-containing protein [Helianthus annuus]